MRVFCIYIYMICRNIPKAFFTPRRIYGYFRGKDSEKVFIVELIMRYHNLMIGICHYGIAALLIFLLRLLGCPAAVGYRCMHMHIRFIKIAFLGKKILPHIYLPF